MPVGMTPMDAVQIRTRAIDHRLVSVEQDVQRTESEITKLSVLFGTLSTKVDTIHDESKEARRERQEREKREAEHALAELTFKRDRSLKVISTVVPTITSLGAAIAAIIAAIYASMRP